MAAALMSWPQLALADTYYSVKAGDSLWKIAISNGITVNQLKEYNTLDSNTIFPGQSLLVAKDTAGPPAVEVSRGTSRTEKILEYAKTFIGAPYRYGGQSPGGFDCSGYLKYVFSNLGIELPRTAEEQFYLGSEVAAAEAKPGDIVGFRTGKAITHTGIYLGGGKFISSTSSHGVEVASVNGYYWADHFSGYRRIIP